jgi:hypothetical protein
LERYAEERRRHHEQLAAARARADERRRDDWKRLEERQRQERREVLRGSWKGRGALLNATRSLLAARQAQEKAALREQQQLERARLREERDRLRSYEDWLRSQSRDLAERWRHRERRAPSIEGPTFEQPKVRDIRAFSAVLNGWKVHYHLAGSRGDPAFTDRGKEIDIHQTRPETVLAALQLSAQKWGTFNVYGGDVFRRTCVELAAEHGFKIANQDLQPAIDAERERLRREREREAAPPRPSRPTPAPVDMTPAAICRRHREEILREQQQGRSPDPSRIDAHVAVRMSVTGHSREQIAQAIRDAARADRPGDRRDWDGYARRATEYAFSPPGREIAERLRHQEQRLLRLEGRQDEHNLLRRLGGPMRGL